VAFSRCSHGAPPRRATSAALYLPGGKPPKAGQLLVERELAGTIKLMMDGEARAKRQGRVKAIRAARDVFYRGEIARRIVAYHEKAGGLLRAEDLAEFAVEVAPALKTSFHGYEMATCGFSHFRSISAIPTTDALTASPASTRCTCSGCA